MGVGSGWGVRGHVPPEFQKFLGFSEKKRIFFGGMKTLWIFFGFIANLG